MKMHCSITLKNRISALTKLFSARKAQKKTSNLLTGMTALCLAVALLAGCSSSPRVTFYTLNVAATNETSAPPLPRWSSAL